MAKNLTDEYRKFRYYEGVCSSEDFVKEIAKVLSMGVKKDAILDANTGEVIVNSEILQSYNWDIVYPNPDSRFDESISETLDGISAYKLLSSSGANSDESDGPSGYFSDLGQKLVAKYRKEKLENQISQITNKVTLRTTTTAIKANLDNKDDLSVSDDADLAQRTMYLQIFKPKYLANPEEYPLDAELQGLTPQLITKEMYQEFMKSDASVIYDLAQLVDEDKIKYAPHKGIVTKRKKTTHLDALSESYTYDKLFADETNKKGILLNIGDFLGLTMIQTIGKIPDPSSRTTSFLLSQAHLNYIKQTNLNIYNLILEICGLKGTFTSEDYDTIQSMKVQITYVNNDSYTISLTYDKEVEVYRINTSIPLDVEREYGHSALEEITPELYSEGRYVPLPDKYLGQLTRDIVNWNEDVSYIDFCLDKIEDDENILYGTVVVRYKYEKENINYQGLDDLKITESVTLDNNHHVLMRLFDVPNEDFSGPKPNIMDNKGTVTKMNSHTSPWSKLSWYQDFEEVMIDHIDEDVSVTSISDGTLLVPLETVGLSADTRLSYWINTNNNRFSMIVMGNPALDYERDRHLISACYCGRIDSFENSINDVSGNFGLFTSSSTTPCKTNMESYTTQYHINRNFSNHENKDTSFLQYDSSGSLVSGYPINTDKLEAYKTLSNKINGSQQLTTVLDPETIDPNNANTGFFIYYITLSGNKYFNEKEMPRYMICDETGQPMVLRYEDNIPVYYDTVAYRTFIYGASDSRSNQVKLYINSFSGVTKGTIYFNFGYYEEKFVITSGITRDVFGNVIDIQTIDDFGKNTSDGVTSMSMYHTRSKAFYQKHHFLFATTEEYMSKVMYGKSSYTGEYYADRIKITHGNDGPRGILCDTLVIDSSSLYPKDELVINKDFNKADDELEETFTYFPITAPFSPLSDGPNARYGLALKKAEREPNYSDQTKLINIGTAELDADMANKRFVKDGEQLMDTTSNGCKIYWSIASEGDHTILDTSDPSDNGRSNWIEDSNGDPSYPALVFSDLTQYNVTRTYYEKDANNVDIVVEGFNKGTPGNSNPKILNGNAEISGVKNTNNLRSIEKTNQKTIEFVSKVNLNLKSSEPIPANAKIIYGYSNSELNNLNENTTITYIIDDGTKTDNIHEYSYRELFIDVDHYIDKDLTIDGNGSFQSFDQEIYNANPDFYLNIFVTKEGTDPIGNTYSIDPSDENNYIATPIYGKILWGYASIPLHYIDSLDDFDHFAVDKSYYDLLQYPCNVLLYVTANSNGEKGNIDGNQRIEDYYLEYNQTKSYITEGITSCSMMMSHYNQPQTKAVSANFNINTNEMLDDLFINMQTA